MSVLKEMYKEMEYPSVKSADLTYNLHYNFKVV